MKKCYAGLGIKLANPHLEVYVQYNLLIIPTIAAFINWLAVIRKLVWLERVTKPLVIFGLLGWLWSVGGFQDQLFWFAIGLAFSFAGDLLLILPKEQFIAGLVAFLITHVAYTIGFTPSPPPINLASFLLTVLITLVAVRVYRRVVSGIERSGQSQLKLPIFAYSIVISIMTLSALLTLVRSEWLAGPALMVSAGALSFLVSDTLLAWNRFILPLKLGDLVVIITYQMGQFLIISGAAFHYLGTI